MSATTILNITNTDPLAQPEEWLDARMAEIAQSNGCLDLSDRHDVRRLRNWASTLLDEYLVAVAAEVQRGAARGAGAALQRVRPAA